MIIVDVRNIVVSRGTGESYGALAAGIGASVRGTGLRGHIASRFETASDFAVSPSLFYSPVPDVNGQAPIPGWWGALAFDDWLRLLGSTVDLNSKGDLVVECTNAAMPPL